MGGLHPLWGIGVTSLIEVILNPIDCNALSADSLPEPGPDTSTSTFFNPCSDAFLPFEDNIETAYLYDVDLIIQPGGSINDKKVKKASKLWKALERISARSIPRIPGVTLGLDILNLLLEFR